MGQIPNRFSIESCTTSRRWLSVVVIVAALASMAPPLAVADAAYRDAVTDLMVAELALRRGFAEEAFERYARVAEAIENVAVTARAAVLASALGKPIALDLARRWQRLAPGSERAARLLAMELARAGHWREALEQIVVLARSGTPEPGAADLARWLRRSADQAAEPRDLWISKLRSAYALYGGRDLRRALIWLLGDIDPVAALALRRPEDQHDGAHPDLAVRLATLLSKTGDTGAAEQVLEDALALNPEDPGLLFALARMQLEAEQNSRARALFERLAARFPGNPDILVSLGFLALVQEDYAAADRALTALAETGAYPDLTELYLGRVARAEGRPREALRHLGKVAERASEFVPARQAMAEILAELGQVDSALELLAELERMHPDQRARTTLSRSEVLLGVGRVNDAIAVLDAALQVAPDDVDLLYARALARERLDDVDGFEADLKRVLELDPDNAYAMNALGYTLANRSERLGEAFEWISRALALAPRDAAILDSMGWVQYRLHNFGDAIAHLRRAHELMPDHEISAHLGEVLWVSGERAEALEIWRRALAEFPESEVLRAVLRRFAPEAATADAPIAP